ncbi:putative late blight resistance protein homolog r1a-6 [Phtheirospermum japonicum]|uniref:Putative late blight resistance protein homolog r1a-6 n=1 Tax=Phtheirospermum japonicum TaxID=374723 RepID=A0A830C3S5_9LAMI|nr:putative late blight resistance protein homolog r1a-6 [Phtheirospermum japonicum]
MACYAAVVSLKETIERLREHSSYKLNGIESTQIIELAHQEVQSVQKLLQKLDVSSGLVENNNNGSVDIFSSEWKKSNSLSQVFERGRSSQSSGGSSSSRRMNGLDVKMREAARELEDALETHQLDLQELKQDIDSFSQTVRELKEEYMYTKEEEEEEEEEEDRVDDDLAGNKMVGYSDVLDKMKDELLFDNVMAVSVAVLVGMAGIGKTTLARAFFDDPKVSNWYDYRVWVTVGPKYQLIDIVDSILNQVNPNTTTGNILTEGDESVSRFHEALKGRRCLVVLDDVWNKEVIPPVRELLQEANFRHPGYHLSMVLVTSRLEKIGADATYPWYIDMIKPRFMNKEESWDLLREKVFGEGSSSSSCTPELVRAGKNIAENCEGLPLTIVTVADILSKADEMTPEYWNQVAERRNSVFVDAYEKMSKVLLRSYEFLPRYLKEYFLYLGVFPQKYDIPISKLALLWGVEGCFLLRASKNIKDLQGYVSRHMEELIGKSLVLVRKTTFKQKPKTYGLHSALWHSCVGEAGKNKFFHVFNKYADCLVEEHTRNQRRLCVHNNILFGIKEARNSMASISTSRSLLCNGPHHQYPVPVCFDHLRLLRVIDALTIRFYEFPTEVVELDRLRYLALTCDGKLPASISKLSNLEILIIHRYLNIVKLHEKDEESSSYLPTEIWDMKELQHLQVIGADLPEPRVGALLPNLVTLLDANARSCTKGVLKGLPKLKKLGVRIELSGDDAEPLSISYHNNKPESLKCVVVNPVFRWSPLVSDLLFPTTLKRLSLKGLGCPWEDINKAVASLPKLEVLKLRCYAFRGAKWETPEKAFRSLEFLLIEDTDLVHWTIGNGSFSRLQCLVLKECYILQDIQPGFRKPLNRIEIADCSPSAVACVKQMQAKRSTLEVYVDSSWDDGKKLKE